MSAFLDVKKIQCANGREIVVGLKLDRDNAPAYVRLQSKKRGQRAEAVIIPIGNLGAFHTGILDARKLIDEFGK